MLLGWLSSHSTYATSSLSMLPHRNSLPPLFCVQILCVWYHCSRTLHSLPLIFQTGLLSCRIPYDFALGAIVELLPLLYAHGTSIFPSQS